MVTITATHTRVAAISVVVSAVIVPVAYKFVKSWLFNRFIERKLTDFGNHELVIEEVIEGLKTPLDDEQPEEGPRGWRRFTPRNRVNLAQVVADEAYFQFGRREKSKANDLITRKFMRDFLRNYEGLRAKDASSVVEVALMLSYVPPTEFWCVREAERTKAYGRRVPAAGPQTC